MKSAVELIAEACATTHVPQVQDVFGQEGVDAIFQIMEAAKSLFREVEPERIKGRVVIYRYVTFSGAQESAHSQTVPPDFASLLVGEIDELVVEVTRDGRSILRHETAALEVLANTAVIYCLSGDTEEFLAGGRRIPVWRLDSSARSQFSVPTFPTLREALHDYASENVQESTCYLFRLVWNDEKRLFFRVKPESRMRESLTQFLRNRIGSTHDVWPEQNVDESHPVDIRVQPKLANNRLMLVEIKWLGDSMGPNGNITVQYRDARAQEGADQLANYIDLQRQSAPGKVVHGFLVIIDGRRKGLKEGDVSISQERGLAFRSAEVEFSPEQHLIRSDFDPPYRMFASPICSA